MGTRRREVEDRCRWAADVERLLNFAVGRDRRSVTSDTAW